MFGVLFSILKTVAPPLKETKMFSIVLIITGMCGNYILEDVEKKHSKAMKEIREIQSVTLDVIQLQTSSKYINDNIVDMKSDLREIISSIKTIENKIWEFHNSKERKHNVRSTNR